MGTTSPIPGTRTRYDESAPPGRAGAGRSPYVGGEAATTEVGAIVRVGLVLGAGGVVGHAFHAGVLAALEDVAGFDARDADLIVGTSAGSVVGALLRAGFRA